MHPRADQDLLLLTLRGDEAAAAELWSRWGSRLIAFATGLLRHDGGHAAACDVVQTVFCRILSADRESTLGVRDVGSWLARAVRNESLNHMRAGDRRKARIAALAQRHTIADAGAFADVRDALDELPDGLREVVLLKHTAGLTFDQMAIVLSDNRNTIASRYAKALKLMRSRLAASENPPRLEVHS
jgi:RNA polymerase sigma-70 factor, ECF subfamily